MPAAQIERLTERLSQCLAEARDAQHEATLELGLARADEAWAHARQLGFLAEQIEAFRNARIVLSPHGAGLTNILFCRPNTTLIEIFPEGGVHGSAFLRIASQLLI